MLAFAAWQQGDGALGHMARDHAATSRRARHFVRAADAMLVALLLLSVLLVLVYEQTA